VFFSLLLNFNFHAYMSEALIFGSSVVIGLFDNLGFEVHFVRMVYLTLFDHSVHFFLEAKTLKGIAIDSALVLLLIMPCFFYGIKFIVAPVHENYKNYGVSLVTPLPLISLLYYECIDVAFLAGFAVLINCYVSWRLMDSDEWNPKY